MPLPDLIEIVPLAKPVRAEITVPGSKSITNRALILAALAQGEVTLRGALWSEDTQVMVECLHTLGVAVKVVEDPEEPCNRTITVAGLGGVIPPGGSEAKPLDLFVGNAGTAARFLAPFLCLGSGVYRLHGVPRMHERPQAALFQALRELGYRVESENGNDKLPARIYGGGNPAKSPVKHCRVSIEESSQFASALLLSSQVGGWQIEIVGENADESPYVVMTSKLLEAFPKTGGAFQIEPDASSGSYFLAAGPLTGSTKSNLPYLPKNKPDIPGSYINIAKQINVNSWPKSGWQIDQQFKDYLLLGPVMRDFFKSIEAEISYHDLVISSKGEISRRHDLGDSIMLAIAIAPVRGPWSLPTGFVKFTDLGRLRVQECERVVALRTELTKCGAKVVEEGDTLTVYPAKPGELHGAEIETYNDHRMAMCFAILGLKVPGMRIKNPACVKKTFPNFFQKLAATPPHGLGVEIWEIKAGQRTRKLSGVDLFAD
jgi:3-phosphoshikimate 1-carboxyvinyltransferase